ncbi:BsuPI-related putative proteinase inhibitor [Bacillaceae bacterium S4-13-58]
MKKWAIFLFVGMFILSACGTSDSASNNSSYNDGDATSGNEGSGEPIQDADGNQDPNGNNTDADGSNSVQEDISALLEKIDFAVEITPSQEKVMVDMRLVNHHSDVVKLGFSSGQQFEVIVKDSEGNEVYKFSEGKSFTEALIYEELSIDEELFWKDEWALPESIEGGSYEAEVTLLQMSINDKPINQNLFSVEKSFEIPQLSNSAFRDVQVTGENGHYTVTGEARVFEGSFMYNVEDGHYKLIGDTPVQVNAGAPAWSDFEIKVEIDESNLPENGTLTMVLFEASPKDGNPTNEWIIPLEKF